MRRIKLGKRKFRGQFALVDNDDFNKLNKYTWFVSGEKGHQYVVRNRTKQERIDNKLTPIRMHRVVMKARVGQFIDHINHDGLDNRKCNLRFCNPSENARNKRKHKNKSSKYRGVTHVKNYNKWRANITINGNKIYLGQYDSELEAVLEYNKATLKYHGRFANPNIIETAKP